MLLAVKAHHTVASTRALLPHLDPDDTVASFQNGLNEVAALHRDLLAFDRDAVVSDTIFGFQWSKLIDGAQRDLGAGAQHRRRQGASTDGDPPVAFGTLHLALCRQCGFSLGSS